ncbi:hypothetical protein QTG54_001409 [Skeletonema marinoi]|uniref:Uncharacterized protein n=1 Tax=Skeletonema marinoi TaxID=267567 RepID=A0AAD9DH00_9STRA|nr:hypothetical protein QTG54_001409 [Skeletonema marinoi]
MATRRKEPLKRRDSDETFFSPSVMALLLVLLFFVAFKVDDEGHLLNFSALGLTRLAAGGPFVPPATPVM